MAFNKYLLLTEFEVCTVSYRRRFLPFDLRPKREGHRPVVGSGAISFHARRKQNESI